ncbi:hypothetical protein [Phenylobacterium sp.]|uniref:hypothetical protein n=1 Tax=Phenylobacterium sp. TaxID=1871053 RepID=UPI0025F4AED4|nr:hypothetical protein [Phenylobacterium sp.]
MTWSQQLERAQALPLREAAPEQSRRDVRPLPRGVGLAIGLAVSLGLWGGLGLAVMHLLA